MEKENFNKENKYANSCLYKRLGEVCPGELGGFLSDVKKITANSGSVDEILTRVDELLGFVNNQELEDIESNKTILDYAVYKFMPILLMRDYEKVKEKLDSEQYVTIKDHLKEIPALFEKNDERYGEIASTCKFGYAQTLFPGSQVIEEELF
jgi:hypothetical protein